MKKYKPFQSKVVITLGMIAAFFSISQQASACRMPPKNQADVAMQAVDAGHTSHGAHTAHIANTEKVDEYSPVLFENINHQMHQGMNIEYSRQVDADFLKGMIPHHQGAIEMAQVALKYSKDEKVRKLAQDIIKAQQQEIEMMKAWLAQKP